ncbi:M4 family metallopeptidase [Streptomyces sp. BE147]|uniref:M4 family metallopeptidase n=1 Tax=Streptomyces sp. BE147 TaxID=3002524 RepID=UPI002E79F8F8|nr:M4 family metallopeptidase [Streptomyces sp. BE147]MEE1741290.1 M4 family metallopeptidase [Streptomyces sp. BE147]
MGRRHIRLAAATAAAALITGALTALPATAATTDDPEVVAGSGTAAPAYVRGLDDPGAPAARSDANPAAAARAHLARHNDVYRVAGLDLAVADTIAAGDRDTVRFTQRHRGVPVLGAQYDVHTRGGARVESVSGAVFTGLRTDTTPKVSESAARGRIAFDPAVRRVPDHRVADGGLVVLPQGEGILAWHFTVSGADASGAPVRQEVYVDAHTGGVAFSYDRLANAEGPAKGSGATFGGKQVALNVYERADGRFETRDRGRSMWDGADGEILTYDARGDAVGNYEGTLPADTPLAASDTAEFGADATASGAVDAHMNAGRVFDYYKGLGRDGIDGEGGTMRSVVNVTQNGKPYGNAFWDGTKMVYGGMNGVPFSVGLDVVGHEMTHGITDHSGGMLYVEQSGALNEAVSDYFGEAMEVDADGLSMKDPEAGLIGEDLCSDGSAPQDCALRDLNDGRRADKDYLNVPLAVDNGGVHLNSTIVGGAMWDMRRTMDKHTADEIIYTALTENFTPWTDFLQARYGIVDAARRLGATKGEIQKIENAFEARGIYPGWENTGFERDGDTLARNVAPAAEAMEQSRNMAVDGKFWAMSYVDLKSFFDGTPEFGIKVGRVDGGEGPRDFQQDGLWAIDPVIQDKELLYTRVGANGADVVSTKVNGNGKKVTVVAGGKGDQREADIDGDTVTWVDIQGDEADVYVRKGNGKPVNITPAAGTSAVRPTIAHGKVSFLDYEASQTYIAVYDLATGTLTRAKAGGLFDVPTDYVHNGSYGFVVNTSMFLGFQGVKGYDLADPANTAKQFGVSLKSGFGTYVQLAVNDTSLVRTDSFAMSWGGYKPETLPKLEIAPIADVVDDGRADWRRVSCGEGAQLYPSLDSGSERVLWSETRGTTDVVTRASAAGTCD